MRAREYGARIGRGNFTLERRYCVFLGMGEHWPQKRRKAGAATPAFQLDPPDRVDGPAFRENDTPKRVVPSREDGQSE